MKCSVMEGFCKLGGDKETFKVLAFQFALELEVFIGRIWQLSLVIIKNLKYPQAVMENLSAPFGTNFILPKSVVVIDSAISFILSLSFYPAIFYLSTYFLFYSFTSCFVHNLIYSFVNMIQNLQVSLTVYLSSAIKLLTFYLPLQKDCLYALSFTYDHSRSLCDFKFF